MCGKDMSEVPADTGARLPEYLPTPLATKVYFTWRSHGPVDTAKWMTVCLSAPDPGEECPISCEPMEACDLEFLPGVTYRDDNRLYRKMQLDCGHSFSAMHLTYHFYKNAMQCPMCRAGHESTLAPVCLPAHFRQAMQARVNVERAKVRRQRLLAIPCAG